MRGLDTLTHTQDDYRNPRCACAPRVNYGGSTAVNYGVSTAVNYGVSTAVNYGVSTAVNCGGSTAVITVSAVSLLLIVTLATVVLTQCLCIIRMRRSMEKNSVGTTTVLYAEVTNPIKIDVPVSINEAYALV